MQPDDIVKITKQPKAQEDSGSLYGLSLIGCVGFISETDGKGYAYVQTLDGNGSGWLPLDHLVPESGSWWISAKATYDAKLEAHRQAACKWGQEIEEALERVAKRSGLTLKQIKQVRDLWREEHPYGAEF